MPSEDDILNALKAVKYPGYSRDIVSFGIVKNVSVANGAVSVSIHALCQYRSVFDGVFLSVYICQCCNECASVVVSL